MTPNQAAQVHIERNRLTRNDGDTFRFHRQQVTEILRSDRQQGSSLMILGVGNGNDVDLGQLLSTFESITLVDLDVEAIEHCPVSYTHLTLPTTPYV